MFFVFFSLISVSIIIVVVVKEVIRVATFVMVAAALSQ